VGQLGRSAEPDRLVDEALRPASTAAPTLDLAGVAPESTTTLPGFS
jgi:hypothetical protein